MKKLITIFITVILMLSMCVSTYANENTSNVYTIGNKTVVFKEDSVFTMEKQYYIAELLVNPETEASSYGLMCTLFGHKNTQEMVTTITHCVNSTSPRCMQENFLITTCSRCEETTVERVSYNFITCCPVD